MNDTNFVIHAPCTTPQYPAVPSPLPEMPRKAKIHSLTYRSVYDSESDSPKVTMDDQIWSDHFLANVTYSPLPIEEFLEVYVPSNAPLPPPFLPNIDRVFDTVPSGRGKEAEMYTPFFTGLLLATWSFPTHKRIQFFDCHNAVFGAVAKSESECRPDGASTHPGSNLLAIRGVQNWGSFSSAFEFKGEEVDDPCQDTISREDRRTLAQITRYGRNLMFSNNSLFAFVIGIYGHIARIYRFDHAGVIASIDFHYVTLPHLLGEFYWRLIHPVLPPTTSILSNFIVGSDTTMTPVPEVDVLRVCTYLTPLGIPLDTLFNLVRHGYYMQARLGDGDTPLRTFVTLGELYRFPGLFSRATAVWKAVPLPRPENPNEIPQVYALKDTWRARYREPEVNNYNRIFIHHRTEELYGLSKCLGSVDFGEMDEMQGHRTHSACARRGTANGDLWDRNHMRSLIFPVGKPLDEFQTTRLLVEGIRDAVKGHENAYLASVLHRDISFGNVMLVDRVDGIRGYLQDFDYSIFVGQDNPKCKPGKCVESVNKALKDITGTFHFTAIDLLEAQVNGDPNPRHRAHHDIESFYWLLVYLTLRHTKHRLGSLKCSTLFDLESRDAKVAADAKRAWLENPELEVYSNRPLTTLLRELSTLVKDQVANAPATPSFLTHQAFLDVFDRALRGHWPVNDQAVPFVMPKHNGQPAQYVINKGNRKRPAEDALESDRQSIQSRSGCSRVVERWLQRP